MKKTTIITLILIILGSLIFYFINITKSIKSAMVSDSSTTVFTVPEEYSALLSNNNKLSFDRTIKSKQRSPVSQFNYGKNFRLNIFSVFTNSKGPLFSIIEETFKDYHMSYNIPFHILDRYDQYDIIGKYGVQDTVSRIILNIYGSGTATILKNDTLAFYYSRIKYLSIKYGANEDNDFFIGVKDGFENVKVPMEIGVLKKKNKIFFLILTSINEISNIEPNELSKLVKN